MKKDMRQQPSPEPQFSQGFISVINAALGKSIVSYLILVLLTTFLLSGCRTIQAELPEGDQPAPDALHGCREDEYSAGIERIGVLKSTDLGNTWRFIGHTCFHSPDLIPVDPSPLFTNGELVLYFLDILTLNRSNVEPTIYRATTSDGLEFTDPISVIFFSDNIITDPYILQLAERSYLMYIGRPSEPVGILSASSTDGLKFILNSTSTIAEGGTPGAIALPDNRVRLFVATPEGIISYISADSVDFSKEPGVRIPPSGIRITDPHPILLKNGSYMMSFVVHPQGEYQTEQERLASMEIHLAASQDGYSWKINPATIGQGSVPGLVETADGSLYIYYVNVIY